jgi:hypothetical protein
MVRYVALAVVLVGGLVLAAEEGVKVTGFTGTGVVQSSDGTVLSLADGATLSQGDTVSLGTGGTLTLEFADGSVMEVAGPARIGLELVADYARTVRLHEGTINRLEVKEVTTGIVSPGGAFVAAQFGTVFARAEPGADGQMRTMFNLLEGTAKTGIKGGDVSVMSVGKPVVFDLEVPGPATTPRQVPAGDGEVIELGMHEITYYPPGGVGVETTADGGKVFTCTAPEGEYAMVVIDEDTTFYLASGESVSFGPDGSVEKSNGTVHLYSPLTVSSFFFDPVKDPAGSSFTGNAVK